MYRRNHIMTVALMLLVSIAVSMIMSMPAMATDQSEAQGLVDKARITFDEFMSDKQYSWFQEHLKYAKGLLIYPQVLKGGFIVGGSGGTGILVVRDQKTNDWSEPAFYTIGSVTLGLQIGGEASQIVVMAMSQKAIDSLLSSSFKFGGDASVALGPIGGGGAENITSDFLSFAKSKGLYAGINLEGAVVNVRDSLNAAYYGKRVAPVDIIIRKEVINAGADELTSALKAAAK
ncbi:MAG: lipid-binding SYLF domain-containing protein [Dissulfurispiraceae bacterium]